MDKFLIIDGNSLAFRAFYALPYLTSSNGEPTGAVFGFCNMFFKVLEEYNPTHVVIAFDFSRKTFRNKIFAEYKGTRKETPEELRSQFGVLKDLLRTMKLNVVEKQCIEADDIIGTFAKMNTCEKVILSGDRDLLQLIDKNTSVWLTVKGITEIKRITTENIVQEFGVLPKQVIDLKALMGDASDNIPGVSGIGPKTATNLITQFDTIENLYENLDNPNITKGVKAKLEADKQNAFMSKTLATIKTDCDIDTSLEKCKLNLPFPSEVNDFVIKYDMNSLLKRQKLFKETQEKIEIKDLDLKVINSLSEIEKVCDNKEVSEMAIYLGQELIFSFNQGEYYKINDEFNLFNQPPEIKDCLQILKKFLEDDKVKKVVYDCKKLKHNLDAFNINFAGEFFDLSLAQYLLNSKEVDEKAVGKYFAFEKIFQTEIEKQNVEKLYYEMELPLEDVLYDMENDGFKINKEELIKQSQKFNQKLENIVEQIYKVCGKEFNLNSAKQTADVLFNDLHLPDKDNEKHSTGVEVLNTIIDSHPVVALIIEYRKLQKLKSSYIDSFLEIIDKTKSDIIHTVFNQTLTSTGRLSSSEPNLQNIPVRSEEGKELRKIFVSRFDGGKLVSADYNQIELRLLAHCSEDQVLIDSFNSGKDVHMLTACQIFGKKESEVTADLRRSAKAINFGIVYGISQFGLSQNANLTREDAKKYIEKYFATYPKIKDYLDGNVEFAKKFGYVKTIFNRKRVIPELKSNNYSTRQFGERAAKNMPLQGSASDIIKFAMLKVKKEFKKQNLQSKLILQIHDELVVDCPKNEVQQVENILQNVMENVVSLKVKLPVAVESGETYYDI